MVRKKMVRNAQWCGKKNYVLHCITDTIFRKKIHNKKNQDTCE